MLLELAGAYLLDHTAEGLGGLCQQNDSRHRAVEAVDDTAVDLTGFIVALLDKILHQVGKTGVAGLVALSDLPRELIDGQQVVVFVEYLIFDQGLRIMSY